MHKKLIILFILACNFTASFAQDTTVILNDSATSRGLPEDKWSPGDKTESGYVTGTFKSTRLINGHTVETTPRGAMDFRVSHRFGTLNNGAYQLFGLDNAT